MSDRDAFDLPAAPHRLVNRLSIILATLVVLAAACHDKSDSGTESPCRNATPDELVAIRAAVNLASNSHGNWPHDSASVCGDSATFEGHNDSNSSQSWGLHKVDGTWKADKVLRSKFTDRDFSSESK
jgi:hypothetical protein